jgi:hypothetical protein
MLNHCLKSTAGSLSLPDRRSEFESWEDTSNNEIRQLAVGRVSESFQDHPGTVSSPCTESWGQVSLR